MTKLPEEVRQWIQFADEDLRSARLLFKGGIYNQACFHCQQSVEKILKAVLLLKGEPFPRVHDLNELLDKCLQANVLTLLSFKEEITALSLYDLPTRYPDALVGSLPDRLPNKKDAEEALASAEEICRKLGNELKGS